LGVNKALLIKARKALFTGAGPAPKGQMGSYYGLFRFPVGGCFVSVVTKIAPQRDTSAPGASGLIWYFGAETVLLNLQCTFGPIYMSFKTYKFKTFLKEGFEKIKKSKVEDPTIGCLHLEILNSSRCSSQRNHLCDIEVSG